MDGFTATGRGDSRLEGRRSSSLECTGEQTLAGGYGSSCILTLVSTEAIPSVLRSGISGS